MPVRPRRKKAEAAPSGGCCGCCGAKPAPREPRQPAASADLAPAAGQAQRQRRPLPPPPTERGSEATPTKSQPALTLQAAGKLAANAANVARASARGSAPLSPDASHELRKSWASVTLPPVLLSARVAGSEKLPTDDVAWGGLGSGSTAMHYSITGTMRRTNGAERTFTTAIRYSVLLECNTRMSHDRLGVHSRDEMQQIKDGLALFPQKSWLGGNTVVTTRERELEKWLDHWVQAANAIENTGHTVEIRNSALARCSALLCEYLNEDTEQQDLIEASLRPTTSQVERNTFSDDPVSQSLLPRSARKSARHPSKPRPRREDSVKTPMSRDVEGQHGKGGKPARTLPSEKLRVEVGGLRSPIGAIRISLWNTAGTWLNDEESCFHCRYDLDQSHVGDGAIFEANLPALPVVDASGSPVEYGCMAIHDLKDLGVLDTNMIGIPRDGISCSNGATGGPGGGPKWEAAKFVLAEEAEIFLAVQYIFKPTKDEKKALTQGGESSGGPSRAQALGSVPLLDLGGILASAVPGISEFSPSQLKRVVKKMAVQTFENHESLLVEGEDSAIFLFKRLIFPLKRLILTFKRLISY